MSAAGEPAPAPAPAPERGATLMEMLVVLAVVALIGAIAFPDLSHGLERAAVDEAARGLRADLRLARAQAIRTDAPVRFVLADDGRSYGWSGGPKRGLVGRMRLSGAAAAFSFLPDGSSSGARLRLSEGALHDDLAVDPVTGLAERPA